MKRFLVIIVLIISTVWGISAQELALDEAITKAARDIEKVLPQRSTVLVLNIVSPSTTFTNYVLEEITDHLIIGQAVSVVDRQNLSTIRAEMNFQYSGEVSDESMVSIGRMLGAQYIVSGSLTERGINYRLRFRIISIETARIINSIIIDLKNDGQVARLIGGERAIQQAERRQQEAERERQREQREAERDRLGNLPKTADARNNWLSVGYVVPTGVGMKYERMLNKNWSLGGDLYFQALPIITDGYLQLGGGITTRLYPFGKAFYIGLGLGVDAILNGVEYNYINGIEVDSEKYLNYSASSGDIGKRVYNDFLGISITLELGWRIDLGKTGGFYMDIGVKIPQVIGWRNEQIYIEEPNYGYSGWYDSKYESKTYGDEYRFEVVPYIGFGIAF